MFPSSDIIAAAVYAALFLLLFALGEIIHRTVPHYTELSRKFVHFSGGMAALSFPFFLQSHWTVLLLTVSFGLILFTTKRLGLLQSIHGIDRVSHGGIYFPVSIYLVFLLSGGQAHLYFIAILVMAVSDALAALIGGRYGSVKYDVEGNLKSLEGSTVFFFVTFLCVHIPLLLMTETDRANSVLIALVIALLVTGFEAISLAGSDNIFIPLGTYFILSKMTRYPLDNSILQVEILLLIILIALFLFRIPGFLRTSGLIGIILLNYASWSLCDFTYFLPLLLAQILYCALLWVRLYVRDGGDVPAYQIRVLLYTGLMPAALILAANALGSYALFYRPYLAGIAIQIAVILWPHGRAAFPALGRLPRPAASVLTWLTAAGITAAVPALLYSPRSPGESLALLLASSGAGYLVFCGLMRVFYKREDALSLHRLRLGASGAGVCVALLGEIWLLR